MANTFIVRTIFLQNYFGPASEMAEQRRKTTDMEALVNAMKRTELADQALEKEINTFAERDYQIVSLIPHPYDADNPNDLLITVILSEAK